MIESNVTDGYKERARCRRRDVKVKIREVKKGGRE